MSLHDSVSVNTHYTRSVNLERDSDSTEVVKAYIPTSRALRTFSRISEAFGRDTTPRAWSLIGPYGSGKSSFSVFLSQLLSCPENNAAHAARKVLKATDTKLANKFIKATKGSDGYLKVLITGAPESMSKRLIKGLAEAAQDHLGTKLAIVKKLNSAIDKELSTTDIIGLFDQLQKTLQKKRCKGILLIIDELGKFLEYEARHYGANDIYLLQALAEHACKGSDANLLLFVLLHQSFEQYAKGLGENLKNEWSKVQGRFEDVPFLESAEQVLRVVSAAFDQNLTKQQSKELTDKSAKVVDVLIKQQAIPATLERTEAISLYSSCYPLHPISAVLLPLLCQKVAQNERTLFSYLGSHEEFGLQFMLSKLEKLGEYIYPHHIYDYFITNQPAALGDYATHRRWAEVVTSIERLGDAPETEINILKTIGILNIIGSKGGFKASKPLLETCLPKKAAVKVALSSLQEKSIINYRKFNTEYRVWQGSDFDLEEALQEELNNVGQFSLATELNAAKNMLPIVARKYTIKTGALRYFVPTFIDAKSYKTTEVQGKDARIIFYLASDQDDEKIFKDEVINYFSALDIVALSLNGSQLREAVAESLALKRVGISRQELNSDPVAKREYEDRLTAAEQAEDQLLQDLIAYPAESNWYHLGKKQAVASQRAMQSMLSTVLESVYKCTPNIYNELVNRDKPSAQANAGRNKLLLAMQNNATQEDLGIEKFPAEKSIYRAVLKETGLHQLNEKTGGWALCPPSNDGRKDKKTNMRHVWNRINAFLDSTEKQPKSFAALNAELLAPPYGVKAGLLPVFYVAVYLVYQHELALYENRIYKPYFTEEMIERFVKRPDEFEFQRFKNNRENNVELKQYAGLFEGNIKITTAEIFRAISVRLSNLSNYALNAELSLTEITRKIRDAFFIEVSLDNVLLNIVPALLDSSSENKPVKIMDVFTELEKSYDKLLISQANQISLSLRLDAFDDVSLLREKITDLLNWMSPYTKNSISLKPFITRVMQAEIDDKIWLENILMYLAKKKPEEWKDTDIASASRSLSGISLKLSEIEKYKLKESREEASLGASSNVYLLSCVKKNGDFLEEVARVDPKYRTKVDKVKAEIYKKIVHLSDEDKLAFLVELTYEYLGHYKDQTNIDLM